MTLAEELNNTESDYLCSECKELLYCKLDGSQELCLNTSCGRFPGSPRTYDVGQQQRLRDEMRDKWSDLVRRLVQCDRGSILGFLYDQRRQVIHELFSQGRTSFEKLLAIDELLIHTNIDAPAGQVIDQDVFTSLLSDYWKIIMQLYQSYGLVSQSSTKSDGLFQYKDIDKQAQDKAEYKMGMDFGRVFDENFDFITQMKYMFERYHRTRQQHNYDPTGLHVAIILGLFFLLPDIREQILLVLV